jgi:RimJ/RimL family protein N-acetyltransferase
LLRKPRLEDACPLFRAYTSDPRVVRFVTWRAHETEDETREFLRSCLSEWSDGTGCPYVIESADEEIDPVGMIHLHQGHHGVNFGFVIAHRHWGKGYATEALSTLVDWSLDQPEVWRASACCDIENLASARVLEKAGMTFEGILRRYLVHPNISPEPRDCRAYAKVRP